MNTHSCTSGSKTLSYRSLILHFVNMCNDDEKPVGNWDMDKMQKWDSGSGNTESIFWKKAIITPTFANNFLFQHETEG